VAGSGHSNEPSHGRSADADTVTGGTYTVYDREAAREKLDELGVHSAGQIRRAHGSYRHNIAEAHDAERLDLHASGLPGQIAANLDALARAKAVLAGQAIEVGRLLAQARDLATPMQDGHGPIAKAMKAAFHERAGHTNGAVRALTEYQRELTLVLTAIQQTMDSYDQSELTARQRLGRAGGDHG
jgi:hypothetical protein